MLVVSMPALFRLGDRANVVINGHPARVHWRDERTLVLNDTDVRSILVVERGGTDGAGRAIVTFTCGDAVEAPETAL